MPLRLPDPAPAETVLEHIPPGADVIVPMAAGEPVALLDAIEAGADGLEGVRLHQMHTARDRPYLHGAFGDRLRHVSYFLSGVGRKAFREGTIDYVPSNFSEVPAMLREYTKRSLLIATVSPPDRHGLCSLGTSADYVAGLVGQAPVFLEVNPNMPRSFGLNQIHLSQAVGWCEHDIPLIEIEPAQPDDRDRAIAALIAERVPNGATLQTGIGAIPNAVLEALRGHRDLGVHTELLSDGVVDLVECGAVTGVRKRNRPHTVVATFALGSRRLYDWMDDNAGVEMLPVDLVNDPRLIGTEPNVVSINATSEVDLYGQCASETVAGHYYSGTGGQADFARGAMYSHGGRAFVVLHSTTHDGQSRIRAALTEGSVVTTMKNTVDHVVTEWGCADLRGQSLTQRARALVAVAHPDHREELERGARERGFLP
ncbi:MAG: acetyl-CoA hydrolase/transferase family protein [Solirubrobacteraceae bacterium]|nr:acetyl-CoA hydrolase/transferase family protein [Solirubrobacteraceae bacterium]